jgi:hypothetical protein
VRPYKQAGPLDPERGFDVQAGPPELLADHEGGAAICNCESWRLNVGYEIGLRFAFRSHRAEDHIGFPESCFADPGYNRILFYPPAVLECGAKLRLLRHVLGRLEIASVALIAQPHNEANVKHPLD